MLRQFITDERVQLQAGRSEDREVVGSNFTDPEAHSVPCKIGQPLSFQQVKWPGHGADLPFPSSSGAEYRESYITRSLWSRIWHVTGALYLSTAILE